MLRRSLLVNPAPQMGLTHANCNLDIWSRMVAGNVPAAYIFEEDVLLHQDLDRLFMQVGKSLWV